MFARSQFAVGPHPRNSRGRRLHATALFFKICAVAFWSVQALDAGEVKDELRRPNIVLILAEDKYE